MGGAVKELGAYETMKSRSGRRGINFLEAEIKGRRVKKVKGIFEILPAWAWAWAWVAGFCNDAIVLRDLCKYRFSDRDSDMNKSMVFRSAVLSREPFGRPLRRGTGWRKKIV